jgi:SAM-dependent methyltransferase
MKTGNPKSRFHLDISRNERVLEVGGGHNPHPRANVVVDKYTETNYHRSGNIKVLKNQTFMEADGESLPFKDKEFDYIICCQVLEHVENPHKFLGEQFRVGKRGFIETPSLLGEYLFPRESHKWIIHEVDNVLYLVDKQKINFVYGYDLGELVQEYLPTHSIGFKVLEKTHPNMITNRIEWNGDFKYVVDPTDPEILKYFTGKWKQEWADAFFPPKSYWQEFKDASRAMANITQSFFNTKVLKKK